MFGQLGAASARGAARVDTAAAPARHDDAEVPPCAVRSFALLVSGGGVSDLTS